MGKQFSLREIQQKYSDFARWYDATEGLATKLLGIAWLRRRWFAQARGPVLEVGCGTGDSLPALKQAGPITMLDLTTAMLEQASRRARRQAGRATVHLLQGNAQQLPFPDDHFATVVSSQSLCTIPDPVAALREMGRVCQPGGRILLLEHGLSHYALINRFIGRNREPYVRSLACHPDRDHAAHVRQAGLELTEERRSHLGIFFRIAARPGPELSD